MRTEIDPSMDRLINGLISSAVYLSYLYVVWGVAVIFVDLSKVMLLRCEPASLVVPLMYRLRHRVCGRSRRHVPGESRASRCRRCPSVRPVRGRGRCPGAFGEVRTGAASPRRCDTEQHRAASYRPRHRTASGQSFKVRAAIRWWFLRRTGRSRPL